MSFDQFGVEHYSTAELCDLLYTDPTAKLDLAVIDDPEQFNRSVKELYYKVPSLKKYAPFHNEDGTVASVEKFDQHNQSQWMMPEKYKQLDIAEWVLTQCVTEEELQRVGKELLMFQERGMFPLLQFLKYFVDTMREHNVVWGVGRGSSTASYVLFLIGVHKINSLYYDLEVEEFLK